MISFRHHITTLVAVFLALAVGVVLGGGPLSEVGRGATEEDLAAARAEADAVQQRAAATSAWEDGFAAEIASRALAGGLTSRSVVLVTMPGVTEDTTQALTKLVAAANGSVAGTYAVQPALVNPNEKSLVDTLGSQLVTSLEDAGVPSDATTYVRIGRLLGRGAATTEDAGAGVDEDATTVVESLTGASLVQSAGVSKRGSLVLVVLGDDQVPDGGVDTIVTGLVTGLAATSDAVVVAGATDSALLAALREDPQVTSAVSTTDSVQTGAGRLLAVLTTAVAKAGTVGSFGASGSDGPAPLG